MAIERDNKILNGEGLEKYTQLLKGQLDGITTNFADAITTAVADLVNGATVITTLKDAEDAIELLNGAVAEQGSWIEGITPVIDGLTTTVNDLTTTVIPEIQSEISGITTDIENIQSDINGITATIEEMQDDISGISTTVDGLVDIVGDITTPLDETFKVLQTAVTITAPAGSYISAIEQDAQGVVSAYTTALPVVPDASTSTPGLVQMASGATSIVVYSKEQVDAAALGISGDFENRITQEIAGLTTVYKPLQEAYDSGDNQPALTFIDYIHQAEDGSITVTLATVTLPSVASDEEAGLVQMAHGATTSVVYDADQVLGLIAGISGDVSGLTNTFKQLQTAVTNPVASGTSYSFITGISQDAQGVITPTAATLPQAATAVYGLVQMASGATVPVVYSADQVDEAIGEAVASAFSPEIASADASGLPDVQNPEENVIYLVPNGTGSTPNYYIEYMYINNGWEVVGNTELAIESLSENEVETIFNGVFNS